ncbi:MAG: DegV family protein [Lachnospiraceae bacterium]|nr:DegV family protein [Lachnospiraceae bacterium]
MMSIAVVTDSNSGITQKQAEEMGIYVLPMPFFINDEIFFEDLTLSQEQFYERLKEDADIKTSQPSPGEVMDLWDKVLEKYDQLIYIPMSSGLSKSCETAIMLAMDDYQDKVFVVNNQRISVTMRRAAMDALNMIQLGYSAAEIKQKLEEEKLEASIYITLETLKYLKKGGRITPAAAAIGTVLNIKPVLQIQGEKLDAYAKVRGKDAGKKKMLEAIRKDLDTRFAKHKGKMHIDVAYSGNPEEAEEWLKEIKEYFPEFDDIIMDPLSLSVACHIGYGALAITVSKSI